MNKRNGFTVIELLVVIAFLIAVAVLGFFQLSKIRDESDNTKKRTAINAMYYSLEEGFYAKNGYYPEKLEDRTLLTMDTALLNDPNNKKIGDRASAYRYEAANCNNGKCKSYKLRAVLAGEDDYVKESRHKQSNRPN